MKEFKDFVSDDKIIDLLCKIRAKEANKRNKLHLLRGLSPDLVINGKSLGRIYKLMPPRRQWVQLNKQSRYRTIDSTDGIPRQQLLNTYEKNLKALRITIKHHHKQEIELPYIFELKKFVNQVNKNIRNREYSIESPKIFFIPKTRVKSTNTTQSSKVKCRPVSMYTKLEDIVIISLANKYLTELFDDCFYEESLAFRARRKYHNSANEIFTSHHDAIDRILEFRNKNSARNIYIAECDIKKFYDTVDHRVVKREFSKLVCYARKVYPNISFSDIKHIFHSYLNSYTFQKNVLSKKTDARFWEENKIDNGFFEAAEREMKNCRKNKSSNSKKAYKVGIPQGGALSGLIANIVLNYVDQQIMPKLTKQTLYIRYCDDMILLATNKQRSKSILSLYQRSLKDIGLIAHDYCRDLEYGSREFWLAKSKSTYLWKEPNKTDTKSSKWIGFVGYEINRCGDIRIRKSSIKKEMVKQNTIVKELLKTLKNKDRVSNSSVINSAINSLISMAVGRTTLFNYKYIKNELCWTNGFKRLNHNQYASSQVKNLDRHRNYIIYKGKKILEKQPHGSISRRPNNQGPSSSIEYYGAPFSYYYHYKKNAKSKL